MTFLVYACEFLDGYDAGTVRVIVQRPCIHWPNPTGRVVPSPSGHGYYKLHTVAEPGMDYGRLEARLVEDMGAVTQMDPCAS
jgi:hypothetical protein